MSLCFQAWACSDAGKVRRHNQDSFLVDPSLGLFAVADGMGGGSRGEVASALACNALQEAISEVHRDVENMGPDLSPEDMERLTTWLELAVLRSCKEVYDASNALTGESGRMGTTLDVVWAIGTHIFTAHVGDGRIYRVNQDTATAVTEDHTLVAEKIKRGILTEEEAKTAKKRNVITRAVGVQARVQVDLAHHQVQHGDQFLLCSDGLYRDLEPETFVQILKSTHGATSAEILVGLANAQGGRDNITALIIKVVHEAQEGPLPHGFAPHIKTLRSCELFSYCTWKELARVVDRCRVKELPPQAWIFKEGQPGRECFIIEHGKVEVIKKGSTRYTLGPGRAFGEMSFIDMPLRTASVRTVEPTRLLMLSRRDFLQIVRQDNALGSKVQWQMLRQLARILRGSTE